MTHPLIRVLLGACDMVHTIPNPIPASWTFSLWLCFQHDRADAVGALARAVAADAAWPGWRSLEGLKEYGQAQRWPPARLSVLQQAWDE